MHPKVYEAAKSGDFDHLITTISGNGEDIFHQTTPEKNNILHVATQYKQVNFIEHLLQGPSGPFLLWQGNSKGDTPLHIAATLGSCEAVQVLIDLAKSLHWVVENGQVDACKQLLRKPNLHMDTALHYAIRGGHDLVVKLLIEEDPQLCDITNAADESPLYLATDRGHLDIIELILGASSLSSSHKGPKGLTALHVATYRSLTSWLTIMEKRPEVIREGDDLGWTPLHHVACFGKVEAVRLLLQQDTSVAYDLDKEGQSALHIAAFRGHVNVVDELVRSCPDACDITNTKGQTALHAAAIGGQAKVVEYILGMPNIEGLINQQDTDGNTAVHLAALHKQYKVIFILARDKRVDRFATNKDHSTTFDIIIDHNEVLCTTLALRRLFKGSHGISRYQDFVIEHVKKKLDKQCVKGQPTGSIAPGSNTANQENFNSSKRSIIDLQLLVAVFIATVTFAAAFTMPGGYNNDGPNQGMATLAGRTAFKGFVISNGTAFVFSIMALIFQYDNDADKVSHTKVGGSCIYIAILGMVLAYACGTYAVLTRTIGLGIVPYVLFGYFVITYLISGYFNPQIRFASLRIFPKRRLPKIWFDHSTF